MLGLKHRTQHQVKATMQCYVCRQSLWRSSTPTAYTNKLSKVVCLTEQDKFIPYEKLSKKEKKKRDKGKRKDWGSLNPVTRKPKNPKAYDRNTEKKNVDKEMSIW